MNTDILKCELAKVMALYIQRMIYGFECDLDLLLSRAWILRNQIAIIEEPCKVNPSILRCITLDINRIQQNVAIDLCTKC